MHTRGSGIESSNSIEWGSYPRSWLEEIENTKEAAIFAVDKLKHGDKIGVSLYLGGGHEGEVSQHCVLLRNGRRVDDGYWGCPTAIQHQARRRRVDGNAGWDGEWVAAGTYDRREFTPRKTEEGEPVLKKSDQRKVPWSDFVFVVGIPVNYRAPRGLKTAKEQEILKKQPPAFMTVEPLPEAKCKLTQTELQKHARHPYGQSDSESTSPSSEESGPSSESE
jgi:hypothetical protein